ncbi:NADH dehydrogenase [ubiquinone] 1 alpha subcomplex subunit [Thalictrum thalictroides]|uniref:NADH dehydrogenase [ubiquinone] 1 alpha subcomplex subunit 12 n=1 Tax=Thalictrum thalictroides TaxID=46969 RepID=A0A7J6VHL8_THATH|nr:NADH dehydrogenase [ubiquinone] 1 alpha subcomplex subunit [Thalictrum thalictroides]
MSKLLSRLAGFFSSRTFVGADKAGNRYFTRKEDMAGIVKEKRWVIFKGEEDPTSVPVEWICWLNGQRKKAPSAEEMAELEAKRERVKLNVARYTADGSSFDGVIESCTDKVLPQERICSAKVTSIFVVNMTEESTTTIAFEEWRIHFELTMAHQIDLSGLVGVGLLSWTWQ